MTLLQIYAAGADYACLPAGRDYGLRITDYGLQIEAYFASLCVFFASLRILPRLRVYWRLCVNCIVLANWNTKTASKTNTLNRTVRATILCGVMHFAGAIGMLYGPRDWFLMLTPINLLVTFFLLLWTVPEKNKKLYFLISASFIIGISAEMIGLKTGMLFGQYSYGTTLGIKLNGVPLLIGINWFIIVYSSGMLAIRLRRIFTASPGTSNQPAFNKWKGGSVILDGAVIATIFDLVMEPAAVKLGFWSWQSGTIPVVNYLSWFLVSTVILSIFHKTSLRSHQFAINLLIIQALFFLVLR